MPDTITKRQLVAMIFVGLLSPLIRRFPRVLAETAGRAAWLSALPAAVPLALAIGGFYLLFRRSPAGTGLAAAFTRTLGKPIAAGLTLLYALWFLAYGGFLLRAGANRFAATVYPGAAPGLFILCMALACGVAASGSLRALGRCAMVLRPVMAAMPLLVFLLTVKDADFSLLLPVTPSDLPPVGLSALQVTNLFGVAIALAFCGGSVGDGPLRPRDFLGWAAALLVLLTLITAGCLGMFGPELTGKMTYPFFMLTRDVSVLGALERVEPVTVTVWVFSDFLLISTLLWTAAKNLRGVLAPEKKLPWLPALCAVTAAGAALAAPEALADFTFLSDVLVPLGGAVFGFGIPLLALAAGAVRRRL